MAGPGFRALGIPAGYAQPQILLYYFTEITITAPPLTRILDRLIGGGISNKGNAPATSGNSILALK